MKYLGIDYGTKRIGLAISDKGGFLAKPLMVVKNDSKVLESIIDLIKSEGVESVVIGESKNQAGQANSIEQDISDFIGLLTLKTFLPIKRVTESFSSFEAHHRQGKESKNARKSKITKTQNLDAKAAAIILQRHLDISKR